MPAGMSMGGKALRLLVVDDDADQATALTRLLRESGHVVETTRARTAHQVRALLVAQAFDAVISAYRLAAFSAERALALLQERGLDTPLIVVSDQAEEDSAVELMRRGARDIVVRGKPARLAAAVDREVGQGRAAGPSGPAGKVLAHDALTRQALMDASLDGICIINQEHAVVEANRRFAAMLGYSPDELLGLHTWDWETQMSEAEIRSRFADLSTARVVFETRHRRRDGSVYDAEVSVAGARVGGESLIFTVSRDITERKRAEEALRTSQAFLDSVIEQSPYPMWVSDEKGLLIRINQACRDLLKIEDDEVVGKYCVLDDPIVASQGLLPRVRNVFERGETARLEIDYDTTRLPNLPLARRTHVLLAATMFPVRDAAGRITHAVIQHMDITERRSAELALRESEERFRGVFQGTLDGILVSEAGGEKVVMANRALRAMLGYSEEEMLRLRVRDVQPAEGAGEAAVPTLDGVGGERLVRSVPLRKKDGDRLLAEVSSVPLECGGKRCRLSVYRDMTEINEAETRMRRAQKMEAVGQLTGGIAHDFNNTLGIILGHSELALRDLRAGDPLLVSLQQIHGSAERAAELTRQLLAFSRKQTLRPRILDLNTTVRGLQNMVQRLVGENIKLQTRLASATGRVKADPGQIEQVIINLIVNARDAMPLGGTLVVETTDVDIGSSPNHGASPMSAGPYVVLAVKDTGVGMDPHVQEHLFEPFFTTKQTGKGTGLGLSTAYGIVKQSGGYIWAHSEPGKGSTFEVYLPRTQEAIEIEPEPAATSTVPGKGQSVLVVEDEPALRHLVRDCLEQLGYHTEVAANGGEALLAVEERGFRPDLLITDVVMPGISGSIVAERLRRHTPRLKVLFMSGYPDDGVRRHGVLEPGTPFIHKPFGLRTLAEKVAQVLRE